MQAGRRPAPYAVRVAELRRRAGIRACDLVRALGMSRGIVYQIEHGGIQEPSVKLAEGLARCLGTTIGWLLRGEGDGPSNAEAKAACMSELLRAEASRLA